MTSVSIGKNNLTPSARTELGYWIQQEMSRKSLIDLAQQLNISYDKLKFCQLQLITSLSEGDIENIARFRGQSVEAVKTWLTMGEKRH